MLQSTTMATMVYQDAPVVSWDPEMDADSGVRLNRTWKVVMPSTNLSTSVIEVSADSLAKKVGIKVLGSLLASPANFFIHLGLDDLLGTGQDDEFKKVFQKLDELQREIASAIDQITVSIEESQLERQHANIETYYGNLRSVLLNSTDPSSGFAAAYESFFAADPVEVLDNISTDIEIVADNLNATGAVSQDYFELVADKLYHANTDIEAFHATIQNLALFYLRDLLHATLVLISVQLHAADPNHRDRAVEHIKTIHARDKRISQSVRTIFRVMPTIISALATKRFRFANKATGKLLGRYFDVTDQRFDPYARFELKAKSDGYYYLKVAAKDVGIDHYYGRDIQPVHQADSGHPNHLWRFVPLESGSRWFRIQNKATGRILDHYHGRDIRTAPLDGHPNHLWELLPDKSGAYSTIVNKATGQALGYGDGDIKAYRGEHTIDVGAYNTALPFPTAWQNICWRLTRDGSEDGFNLVNAVTGEALDHYDGESFRFVPAPSGNPNHLWRIEPTTVEIEGDLYNFIRNRGSGQVLDHYYGEALKGADDTNAQGPHPNHIWRLEAQCD